LGSYPNLHLPTDFTEEADFQDRLNYLNNRYEGFFVHQRNQGRWEARRRSGVPDVKKERKRYEQYREKVRNDFVRQPPKDMEPLRLRWEAQQEKQRQKHAERRRQFAKQRARLEAIEVSAKKIPAMKELDIDVDPRERPSESDTQDDSEL
jgi:hypothetical protein